MRKKPPQLLLKKGLFGGSTFSEQIASQSLSRNIADSDSLAGLFNHVAPVLRSAEQRSARTSTRPAATRAIRTYAHMVTRRFAPRDGLHFLVRSYGFTETLRRAAQREGVGMPACHGLGVYIGECGRSVSPYGGLPEPNRLLRILFVRRFVTPEWLPYGQI